jgi:hypothetical protein
MPCAARKARLLLRDNKATVLHRTPFTIKLSFGASGFTQEVVGAMDTGSTVIGSAAVANGKVVYQAEVKVRNDITGKMEERRSYRRTRRARNTRYRPARFNNRCASKRKGRLPPSIKSKVESHFREVRFVESILPVTRWNFELASFDIHRITNPDVSGVGYQNGALKDFYNTKNFVYHRDGYKCQSGQKGIHSKKLHAHHIIFRSNGGPDTPANLTTLCETCHAALHAGKFSLPKGKRSKTKHATEMGVIKAQISKSTIPHDITFGYETKYKREQFLKWPKTHANDAVAACLIDGEIVTPMANILIKTHTNSGDYKQTFGKHGQLRTPTGKLFGFRKGDIVLTPHGIGYVKGKRSSGYFLIGDCDGNDLHASERAGCCKRLTARTTTQLFEMHLETLTQQRKRIAMSKLAKKDANAAKSALFLTALNGDGSRAGC